MNYQDVLAIQKDFFISENKPIYDLFTVIHINHEEHKEDVYKFAPSTGLFDRGLKLSKVVNYLKQNMCNELYEFIVKNKNIILAGGIFSNIMYSPSNRVDYDLFIVGDCDTNELINSFINIFGSSCIVYYSENAITVNYIYRHYQIVLRQYTSISEVLHGFDMGSSCVAWDGESLYTTSMGKYAFKYGMNIVDMSLRSMTYEIRLQKYAQRGFGFVLPDLKYNNQKCIITRFINIKIHYKIHKTLIGVIYYVKNEKSYDVKIVLIKYFSADWIVPSVYSSSWYHEHQCEKCDAEHDIEACAANIKKNIYSKYIDNGYKVEKSNPTTQKFGMVDPSSVSADKWYEIFN